MATAADYYMLLQFTSHPARGGGKGKVLSLIKNVRGFYWKTSGVSPPKIWTETSIMMRTRRSRMMMR